MGKGIGYVNFDSTAAVELALQMDGQELKKRCVNVKRCLSTKLKKKTKSFGKKKTEEMVEKLLSKRNQTKIKTNKKNKMKISKLESSASSFTGNKANVKKKKQKVFLHIFFIYSRIIILRNEYMKYFAIFNFIFIFQKPSQQVMERKKIVKILEKS